MKKIDTSPLSGMQELLPAEQALFNQLKENIADVYHRYGFQNIETPIIDRTAILFAKAGGDTEKQIYRVIKTEETAEDADQALRFDHTVPLARYVVEHQNDLTFPFLISQIGRNFRGERAQKGRFREFYQCDVDVVGRNNLSIAYDPKVIATIYAALRTFDLPDLLVRISNRKLLSGFLTALGLGDRVTPICNIIDHAEKVTPQATQDTLLALNISPEIVSKLTIFINTRGSIDDVENTIKSLLSDLPSLPDDLTNGLAELRVVYEHLTIKGIGEHIAIDCMIVRGLDYYTGTVFEFSVPSHKEIGSIAGGGRYEHLASNFTDQAFPGVGGSIGLTRLFSVLSQNQLIKANPQPPIDYCLIPLTVAEYSYTFLIADQLRAKKHSVDIILTDKKLGEKLAHAARIANNAIVIGEEEARTGNLTVKNLQTNTTTPFSI